MKADQVMEAINAKLYKFIDCQGCGHLIHRDRAITVEYRDKSCEYDRYDIKYFGSSCAPEYRVVHYGERGNLEPQYYKHGKLDGVNILVPVVVGE